MKATAISNANILNKNMNANIVKSQYLVAVIYNTNPLIIANNV